MSFHVYLLPVDTELAADLEAALVDRSRLRRLQSPAELVDCAANSTLVRAIVTIDDAARLDAAWWREIRKRAANAELLVAARHCAAGRRRTGGGRAALGWCRRPAPAVRRHRPRSRVRRRADAFGAVPPASTPRRPRQDDVPLHHPERSAVHPGNRALHRTAGV